MVIKLDSFGNIGQNCGIMNNSLATIYNANIVLQSSAATAQLGSALVYISAAIVYDTSAMANIRCISFPAGRILNNLFLNKSGNSIIFDWQAPVGNCFVNSYGIYRGLLLLSGYNNIALECSISATSFNDQNTPDSYYYLVVSNNLYSEGSYGLQSKQKKMPQTSFYCMRQMLTCCN